MINQYYVYDYDEVFPYNQYQMTALHWAAKRGNFEICYILLKFYAHINAIDIVKLICKVGRTPLYIAL